MAVPCRRRRAGPSPAGQYSQYPSSFSPFARLARRILVTTALELAAVKTPRLASSEAVNSSPTFPLLFLPVCFRLSPDRLTTNRADMLSFVSLFCDSYVPFLSLSPHLHRPCRVSLLPQTYSLTDSRLLTHFSRLLAAFISSHSRALSVSRLSPSGLSCSELTSVDYPPTLTGTKDESVGKGVTVLTDSGCVMSKPRPEERSEQRVGSHTGFRKHGK